jgi:hypothetical protein
VKNIVKEFESGIFKTVSNVVLHDVMSSYRDGTRKNITASFQWLQSVGNCHSANAAQVKHFTRTAATLNTRTRRLNDVRFYVQYILSRIKELFEDPLHDCRRQISY